MLSAGCDCAVGSAEAVPRLKMNIESRRKRRLTLIGFMRFINLFS
jgi:hypothetical protein